MLPDLLALQRAMLQPWLDALRLQPNRSLPERLLMAPGEAAWRSLEGALGRTGASLLEATRRHAGWTVREENIEDHPFVTVRRFASGSVGAPPVLLLAPHSGYATAVLGQLVAALLRDHEVVVTDWRDARDVPTRAGRFGLEQQVLLAERLIATHAAGGRVVALSQAVVPALAATALLAAGRSGIPERLALLGGPVDARIEPPPFLRALRQTPAAAWTPALLQLVTPPFAGAGRRVYPGVFQLAAYASASPANYVRAQVGLVAELIEGKPDGRTELHADLHAVIDVPGELFGDMLEQVLLEPALPEGRLVVQGRTVDPATIEGTTLLTLEAGADELIGRGQTHAALALCRNLPDALRHSATLDGLQHHDLFVGPSFARQTAPMLLDFLAGRSRPVSPADGPADGRRARPAPGG